MKISEIDKDVILNHIREVEANLSQDDLTLIDAMKAAAVAYVSGQTGLDATELDNHEDLTIVALTAISDMWDNRSLTIDRSNPNNLVENILYQYSENLLPSVEVS